MKQGEVRWYVSKSPGKRRPVLILTRTSALSFLNAVTIAPITTTIRGIPTEVVLSPDDGLVTDCAVNLDNLQTVPKANLGALITMLSPAKLHAVRAAIGFALGFDTLDE